MSGKKIAINFWDQNGNLYMMVSFRGKIRSTFPFPFCPTVRLISQFSGGGKRQSDVSLAVTRAVLPAELLKARGTQLFGAGRVPFTGLLCEIEVPFLLLPPHPQHTQQESIGRGCNPAWLVWPAPSLRRRARLLYPFMLSSSTVSPTPWMPRCL